MLFCACLRLLRLRQVWTACVCVPFTTKLIVLRMLTTLASASVNQALRNASCDVTYRNEWMGMLLYNGIFINFELEKWISCFRFYMKVDELIYMRKYSGCWYDARVEQWTNFQLIVALMWQLNKVISNLN